MFTTQGSKFISEDELKLVHMIRMVDANVKESLTHGLLQHGDVASYGDMASIRFPKPFKIRFPKPNFHPLLFHLYF